MTDKHDDVSKNQPINSAANLPFLLRTLARQAQARASDCKSCLEPSISDEQVKDVGSKQVVMEREVPRRVPIHRGSQRWLDLEASPRPLHSNALCARALDVA